MASWSQTFSVNNKYSITLNVTESSYSIQNNTSVVAYSLTMQTAPSSYVGFSNYRMQVGISLNGSKIYSYDNSRDFNPTAQASYSETLASGTVTITHAVDGSKTIACAANVTVASGSYSPGAADISGQSLALTTIPRASTISGTVKGTIDATTTINITRTSSSFTHKLKFTLGTQNMTLPSGSYAGDSYSWTPSSADWLAQFPTQTSRSGTLTLETYYSGSKIGENSYTFTLSIPSDWKPTVGLTLTPSSSIPFTGNPYVATFSAIQAAITGTASNGAAISKYEISGAFSKTVNTSSGSTTQTSGTISTSGTKTVTVKITDARGLTATVSKTCTFLAVADVLSTASWSGSFTIDAAKSITITRQSTSFQHKLKFTVGSASETLPSGSYAATSYSWTPAAATYAAQLPTQTSITGTLKLSTYNGSTLLGSVEYSITLAIPSSWAPTVSVTLTPTNANAYCASINKYVAGYSKIHAAITGAATQGAAIVSYTISGAFSKTLNTSAGSTSAESGIIATSGSKTVTVKITDARGKTKSVSATCTYLSYAAPAISALSYARGSYVGGSWTASDTGTDLKVTFTGACSLGSQSPANKMTWSIGSPVSQSGSNLSNGGSITQYKTGIGTTTAYSILVTVTDAVGNSASRKISVPTLEIPFVIDPTKPAIGIGGVPNATRVLNVSSTWGVGQGRGLVMPSTTDILAEADAMTTNGVKFYTLSGSDYTGNIPFWLTAANCYGIGIAAYRTDGYRFAAIIPNSASYGVAVNNTNTGAGTWVGWRSVHVNELDGILPITKGGTGAATAAAARTALDVFSTSETRKVIHSSIASGGTAVVNYGAEASGIVVFCNSAYTAGRTIILSSCSASGTVYSKNMDSSTSVSLTNGSSKLTITNGVGGYVFIDVMVLYGVASL